jgi:predicted TIM-barrel fold metal-dependent hydrolase
VLFGSDYPWEEPGRATEIIKSLGLSKAEEQAILFQNAAKLLGLESIPVQKLLLL